MFKKFLALSFIAIVASGSMANAASKPTTTNHCFRPGQACY